METINFSILNRDIKYLTKKYESEKFPVKKIEFLKLEALMVMGVKVVIYSYELLFNNKRHKIKYIPHEFFPKSPCFLVTPIKKTTDNTLQKSFDQTLLINNNNRKNFRDFSWFKRDMLSPRNQKKSVTIK